MKHLRLFENRNQKIAILQCDELFEDSGAFSSFTKPFFTKRDAENWFRLFEELNQGEPEIGDYVICEERKDDEEEIDIKKFINNNIGQLVGYPEGEFFMGTFDYWVKYEDIPAHLEYEFYDEIRPMRRKEIKFWSKNEKDLEIIFTAKNLFPKREYCYYIPYGNLLLVKFALEKLNVVNTDRIIDEIKDNFKNFLGVYIFMSSGNDGSFWVIRHKSDLEGAEDYIKNGGVEYRGIFELEPHELASFNYNL